MSNSSLYGYMAEFETPPELVEAARKVHEAGYRRVEAFSPFPVHDLAEAIGYHRTILPWIVFAGGLTGCLTGFLLQYWISVVDYPLNIGGKPLNSWPSFIIVTFEMTILFAALSAVVGMLALNGLPMPYHAAFNVKRFRQHASSDGFFLCIEAGDSKFDREDTRGFLQDLRALNVMEVRG